MGFSFSEMSGWSELMRDRSIWKAFVAEFLGTLLLVFVGCASTLNWDEEGGSGPTVVQIALCFGITLATLVQAIGHISGCHINPAVTTGMMIAAKMKPIKAALYILFQCLGAVAGAALLKAFTPEHIRGSLGVNVPSPEVEVAQALGIELIITFVLVLTIFGVCDPHRDDVTGSAPLAIGLSVTACNLSAMKYTGSSMNPARTFGPALIASVWTEHWLYWVGPCAGGALAGLLYRNLFSMRPEPREENQGREYEYEPCAKREVKQVGAS